MAAAAQHFVASPGDTYSMDAFQFSKSRKTRVANQFLQGEQVFFHAKPSSCRAPSTFHRQNIFCQIPVPSFAPRHLQCDVVVTEEGRARAHSPFALRVVISFSILADVIFLQVLVLPSALIGEVVGEAF